MKNFSYLIEVLNPVKRRMYKAVMAQTHLSGWVIGQPPGCVFGSLSKQYGASPAALCKHPGPDPKRSKNSFSESSLRGCRLSLWTWSMKECGDTSRLQQCKKKKRWTSAPGTFSRGLKVNDTNGAVWACVYKTFKVIKKRGVKVVSAGLFKGKYTCTVSSTLPFPLFSRFPV